MSDDLSGLDILAAGNDVDRMFAAQASAYAEGLGMAIDAAITGAPRQGWQCPRCGKVHAPWVAHCDCQGATRREQPDVWTATTAWVAGDVGKPPRLDSTSAVPAYSEVRYIVVRSEP